MKPHIFFIFTLFLGSHTCAMECSHPNKGQKQESNETEHVYEWLFQTYKDEDGNKQCAITESGAYVPNYGLKDIIQLIGKHALKHMVRTGKYCLDQTIKSRILASCILNDHSLQSIVLEYIIHHPWAYWHIRDREINPYLKPFTLDEFTKSGGQNQVSIFFSSQNLNDFQTISKPKLFLEEKQLGGIALSFNCTWANIEAVSGTGCKHIEIPFLIFIRDDFKKDPNRAIDECKCVAQLTKLWMYLDEKIEPNHILFIQHIFNQIDNSGHFRILDLDRPYKYIKKIPSIHEIIKNDPNQAKLFSLLPAPIRDGLLQFDTENSAGRPLTASEYAKEPEETMRLLKLKPQQPKSWLNDERLLSTIVILAISIWFDYYYHYQQ